MLCHECAAAATERPAVAVCRFCFVGLCKQHLVELFGARRTAPQYACTHRAAEPWPARGIQQPAEIGTAAAREAGTKGRLVVE